MINMSLSKLNKWKQLNIDMHKYIPELFDKENSFTLGDQ